MPSLLHLGRVVSSALGPDVPLEREAVLATLADVEAEVWGTVGLRNYEEQNGDEVARLVRRSFAQYLVQQRSHGFMARLVGSTASLLLLPICALWFTVRGLRVIHRAAAPEVAIYHYPYLRPLIEHKSTTAILIERVKFALDTGSIFYLVRCLGAFPRAIFHPRFMFSALKWVAAYAWVLRAYSPGSITNFIEGSFSSSISTGYLRERGVVHESHMHGELYEDGRAAFCEVDRFVVFGSYWARLLRKSCCKGDCRVVANPHYCELKQKRTQAGSGVLLVHSRLLVTDSEEHRNLLEVVRHLPAGSDMVIRFHPNERKAGKRYARALRAAVRKLRPDVVVRDDPYQSQPLKVALCEARVVVGPSSAALTETWVAGRRVIYLSWRAELAERYGGSPNIISMDNAAQRGQIARFLESAGVDDDDERCRVAQLAAG